MVFDIKQVYNSTHTSFWHASDHTTIGSGSFAKKYLSYRTVQLDADINLWLTSVTVQKERKKKDKKKKKEKRKKSERTRRDVFGMFNGKWGA